MTLAFPCPFLVSIPSSPFNIPLRPLRGRLRVSARPGGRGSSWLDVDGRGLLLRQVQPRELGLQALGERGHGVRPLGSASGFSHSRSRSRVSGKRSFQGPSLSLPRTPRGQIRRRPARWRSTSSGCGPQQKKAAPLLVRKTRIPTIPRTSGAPGFKPWITPERQTEGLPTALLAKQADTAPHGRIRGSAPCRP